MPVAILALALLAGTSVSAAAGPLALLVWAIASRLIYVGWVGLTLRTREADPAATTGPSFHAFRTRATLLMTNDAVAIAGLALATSGTLDVPWGVALVAGAMLSILGVACKMWACTTLGFGACVWQDFFEGPSPDGGRWDGPYRFLDNPMYTVGYLQAWAFPLMVRSAPGVIAGLFAHASILVFWWIVERPHARAYYARTS